MFDVKILLDECNIIYTSEQLEKLKGLIEEEIFKIILPEEKSTENSEMSMTEDHTSNENENQNENKKKNQNVQKDGQGNVHGQRMTCEHDIKYADLSHGFKKYLSCQNGQMKQETCPRGSIFYFLIQCCVPISKYPCKSNCIGVPGKNVYEMDSYDYFNY